MVLYDIIMEKQTWQNQIREHYRDNREHNLVKQIMEDHFDYVSHMIEVGQDLEETGHRIMEVRLGISPSLRITNGDLILSIARVPGSIMECYVETMILNEDVNPEFVVEPHDSFEQLLSYIDELF